MTDMYIPPTGIYFRLLGFSSNDVIFSRSMEPQVNSFSSSTKYDDQYFTLVPGTGTHQGTYLIRSKVTEKVLFCRDTEKPYVGHTDVYGTDESEYYGVNWFKIEPGTGKYAKHFRLRTPVNDIVIFTRTDMQPWIGYHPAKDVFANHFFSFDYEDMEFVDIVYDIKAGKLIQSPPYEVRNFVVRSRSTQEQESSSQEYTETVTNTSQFEESRGLTISAGVTISGSVPGFADVEVRMDASATRESKWGKSETFTKTWVTKYPAKAQPGRTVRVIVTIERGSLEVPYKIRQKSKSTGQIGETTGIWKGVSSGNTTVEYRDE